MNNDSFIDFDMRGALERVADDLVETAKDLDGKETRCRVSCRYGYITKAKVILSGQFKKIEIGSALVDEVMQYMYGDPTAKSKVFKVEFRIDKKVERGHDDVSFLSIIRFPCL